MHRECSERFPRYRRLRKPLVRDPSVHHGTCVTHVPWCMSGSLTRGGGENVPGIPGACATSNFTYLARGPWLLVSWRRKQQGSRNSQIFTIDEMFSIHILEPHHSLGLLAIKKLFIVISKLIHLPNLQIGLICQCHMTGLMFYVNIGDETREFGDMDLAVLFTGRGFFYNWTTGNLWGIRAPSQYKDRLIYVWRFPC